MANDFGSDLVTQLLGQRAPMGRVGGPLATPSPEQPTFGGTQIPARELPGIGGQTPPLGGSDDDKAQIMQLIMQILQGQSETAPLESQLRDQTGAQASQGALQRLL